MPLITWNPTYSVGVKEFDGHHKVLIDLINQMHDAMLSGKGNEELGNVLQKLSAYTVSHFAAEEKLMKLHAYPDYFRHKGIHDALIKQVVEIQAKFASNAVGLSVKTSNFLKDWLTTHIQGEDAKYTAFFNSKNIS